MSTEVQIFSGDLGQVRTVDVDGEPWFVAADICKILGLTNITMSLSRLDEADITSSELRSGGQRREMKVVNESGMYDLVFESRKPEARKFRRWVTDEVIPSIRKTGKYEIETKDESAKPISVAEAKRIMATAEKAERLDRTFHRWTGAEVPANRPVKDVALELGYRNGFGADAANAKLYRDMERLRLVERTDDGRWNGTLWALEESLVLLEPKSHPVERRDNVTSDYVVRITANGEAYLRENLSKSITK